MLIPDDTICRNHYQLDGMSLNVLFAAQESIVLVARFFLVLLVNRELMLTELHLTKIVSTFTLPLLHEADLT